MQLMHERSVDGAIRAHAVVEPKVPFRFVRFRVVAKHGLLRL